MKFSSWRKRDCKQYQEMALNIDYETKKTLDTNADRQKMNISELTVLR